MKRIEHNKTMEKQYKNNARSAKLAVQSGEALRALALPETTSRKYPCITLLADKHVEVENYTGVIEIGNKVVRLKTETGILRIEGERLEIRNAEALCALIDGKIRLVCYETNH